MSQIIQTQKGKKKSSFIEFLKKECVLVIAVTLAILSSFISIPKLSYIDFKVLILLFNLMVVVAAFKELKVLDSIAIGLLKKCNTYTSISLALVFITFISSMIVTNDVALITFVPLSIVIARKANINVLKIVVFQTLAANLGSSFTPMGNPQNLFIYSFYNLSQMCIRDSSMPIPVCEFGRSHFSKCFKGEASYGICASKKETYFGFKFHALTTVDGFLTDYVITPANIDDRNAVWDLCDKYRSISIIGDKGYINKRLTPELKGERDIDLLFLKRANSRDNYPKEVRQLLFKVRRRIETSFSQLTE